MNLGLHEAEGEADALWVAVLADRELGHLVPSLRFIEGHRLRLERSGLEHEQFRLKVSSVIDDGVHESGPDAEAAKVRPNPEPFDLGDAIGHRADAHTAGEVSVKAGDEERSVRWGEVFSMQRGRIGGGAVAAVEIVLGREDQRLDARRVKRLRSDHQGQEVHES